MFKYTYKVSKMSLNNNIPTSGSCTFTKLSTIFIMFWNVRKLTNAGSLPTLYLNGRPNLNNSDNIWKVCCELTLPRNRTLYTVSNKNSLIPPFKEVLSSLYAMNKHTSSFAIHFERKRHTKRSLWHQWLTVLKSGLVYF